MQDLNELCPTHTNNNIIKSDKSPNTAPKIPADCNTPANSGIHESVVGAADITNNNAADNINSDIGSDDNNDADTDISCNSNADIDNDGINDINTNVSDSPCAAKTKADAPKPLADKEITDYTAALWKYNPIPENEPEPYPEYINKTISYPGGTITAARVRGKKHKHDGTNCDDWFETANYKHITFIAVSDGAGSKKFSRIGARESCKAAAGYLKHSFKKEFENDPDIEKNLALDFCEQKCMEVCGVLANIVQKAVIKAYEAVESAFYSRAADSKYSDVLGRNLELRDLSATLLLAVVIPLNNTAKENLVIACQIGDGAIALLNSKDEFDSSVKLMSEPDSGDFSGETDFLTSPKMQNIELLKSKTKISRGTFDTLFVMTDGVADDYFPNETEIHRLYYDLIINGIIELPENNKISLDSLTPQHISMLKKIPNPSAYPWVNDKNIKVPVQYTNLICKSAGLSLKDIWNDFAILNLSGLELEKKNISPDERLKIWLDNYVERGSFDDRTLVIVRT